MPSGFRHQLMLKYARCNLSCAIPQKLFSGQVSCTPIYADRDSLKAQEAFKAFNLSPLEVSEDVCDTVSSEVVLNSELLGVGFHRSLRYSWTHEPLAPAGSISGRATDLQIGIVQVLPPGIYADIYQLDNLARFSGGDGNCGNLKWSPALYGVLDVEKTAVECELTVLVLNVPTGCGLSRGSTLEIPLHARYPSPQRQIGVSTSLFESAMVEVRINAPSLVKRYGHTSVGSASQYKHQRVNSSCVLVWSVPAGNMNHLGFVTVGTGLAALLASIAVALAAFKTQTDAKPV